MWSGSVAIAIARNADQYEDVEGLGGFALSLFRVLGVPRVLHGSYDTLLKMDMNGWALGVALLSSGWFAWHVKVARNASPGAGRARRLAY